MKTKKERTIKAIRDLIVEYHLGTHTSCPEVCPLCKIHYVETHESLNCDGCPNTVFDNRGFIDPDGYIACVKRQCSPSQAKRDYWTTRRALQFWKAALHAVTRVPAEKFTKKGFTMDAFDELLGIDERVDERFKKYCGT
jgi:hypothetical protein